MTYSIDFRRKVLDTRRMESLSLAKVAKRFGVGIATVVRWEKRIEAQQTRNKPATKIDMDALIQDIREHPDAYQHERAERLCVSASCIFYALRRLNVTFKKNTSPSKDKSRSTTTVSK